MPMNIPAKVDNVVVVVDDDDDEYDAIDHDNDDDDEDGGDNVALCFVFVFLCVSHEHSCTHKMALLTCNICITQSESRDVERRVEVRPLLAF